jgi:hypothetical protein
MIFGLWGLKLIFLVVSRAISLLRLSRREDWWKDAEISRPGARIRHGGNSYARRP